MSANIDRDTKQIRVRSEKGHVYLCIQGRPALEIPWEAAIQLSKALHAKAMEAREDVHHGLIISDQAMLLGLGAPIGISGNRKLLNEARKAAEDLLRPGHLRRKRPMKGITSPEKLGLPTIITHPPQGGL